MELAEAYAAKLDTRFNGLKRVQTNTRTYNGTPGKSLQELQGVRIRTKAKEAGHVSLKLKNITLKKLY